MKKIIIILLCILLVVIIAVFLAVQTFTADVNIAEETTFTIEEGSGTAAIAEQLYDEGMIRNTYAFRLFAKYQNIDSLFKAGEYTFKPGFWSLASVCEQLVVGGVSVGDQIKLTITEGLRIKDIVKILVNLGVTTEDAFYNYVTNGEFAYDYLPAAGSENRLEGFLAPDTYWIDPEWTEVEIVDMLLKQFDSVVWTDEYQSRAEELNMTVVEVITLASIVEREAVIDEDRPLIAGVFYNRLDIGMPLQSNVTVEYAMGEWKLDLTNEDIKIDSPYNTYIYTDLPPGPVCMPGVKSIQATLYPTESEYLYFWGQVDGSSRFSKTLAEHQAGGEGDL